MGTIKYPPIPTIWSSHENHPDQSCLGQDLRISKPLYGHGPWDAMGSNLDTRTCNTKTVTTVGFSSVISWPPTSNADYSCTLVLMSFYTPRARQTWIRSVVNLDIFIYQLLFWVVLFFYTLYNLRVLGDRLCHTPLAQEHQPTRPHVPWPVPEDRGNALWTPCSSPWSAQIVPRGHQHDPLR